MAMTRLPLQTGSSALRAWMTMLGILPAMLFLPWGVLLLIFEYPTSGLVMTALGGLLGIAALLAVPAARRRRASDIAIDERGFTIEGGPHHGLRVDWARLVGGVFEAQSHDGGVTQLVLELANDHKRVLAETDDASEAASLANVAKAIQAQSQPGEAPAPVLPPEAPSCAHCGAPIAPTVQASSLCGYCGNTSATSPSVLRRMQGQQAHAAASVQSGEAVKQLLDQPTASTANVRMVWFSALAALLVSLFAAGELFLASIGIAEMFTLGVSAVMSLLLVGVVSAMATRRFIDRHAMQSLLAIYGAQAPRRKGEPWCCRGCGAPLPTPGQLVTCVFCERSNVLGADLRRSAEALATEAERLEEVLEQRRSKTGTAKLVFWALAPAALLCALIGVFFIALGLEHLAEGDNCEGGEARACVSLAFSYSDEDNFGRDLAKAARLAERACLLDDIDGCCLARQARKEKWGSFARAAKLKRRLKKKAAELDEECWQ
jgi:TPR repeat protein